MFFNDYRHTKQSFPSNKSIILSNVGFLLSYLNFCKKKENIDQDVFFA